MNRIVAWTWAIIALGFVGACKKGDTDCVLHVALIDAGEDLAHPPAVDLSATLKQQLLSGGVLTSAFTVVAEGSTDTAGNCDLKFKKENALVYRLDLQASDWFSRQIEFNPDDFLPGDTVHFTAEMMPRATLRVHLEAGLLAGPGDVLQFRTLHVPGDYPTCSNAWHTFDHLTGADTTWVCDMEGGANVAYTWKVTRDGETVEFLDSLVATRFEETTMHVLW
jgi:hypothetical protein